DDLAAMAAAHLQAEEFCGDGHLLATVAARKNHGWHAGACASQPGDQSPPGHAASMISAIAPGFNHECDQSRPGSVATSPRRGSPAALRRPPADTARLPGAALRGACAAPR